MSPTLHLKSDTPKRPVIDFKTIEWILREAKFGCHIWPSTNAFPTIFSAVETRLATIPNHADTKIGDLNVSIEIDQDIFWFDITMNDSNAVKSCNTNGLKNIA
jgi:hypothetical protein